MVLENFSLQGLALYEISRTVKCLNLYEGVPKQKTNKDAAKISPQSPAGKEFLETYPDCNENPMFGHWRFLGLPFNLSSLKNKQTTKQVSGSQKQKYLHPRTSPSHQHHGGLEGRWRGQEISAWQKEEKKKCHLGLSGPDQQWLFAGYAEWEWVTQTDLN